MTKLTGMTFAALLLLAACGDTGSTGAATNSTGSATTVTTPIALKATGKAEGLDFTITDVTTRNQIGPAEVGSKTEAGETFVVVAYTLKNTSDRALPYLERPGISLIDKNGRTYAPDDMAGGMVAVMMDDPSGMTADLNPNVSAKTKTAWKVDKASFDRGTWKLVVASDPQLTFALK